MQAYRKRRIMEKLAFRPSPALLLGALTAGGVYGAHRQGFFSLLKTGPNEKELSKAMALYEKKTGKPGTDMSFHDINTYVKKVRR